MRIGFQTMGRRPLSRFMFGAAFLICIASPLLHRVVIAGSFYFGLKV